MKVNSGCALGLSALLLLTLSSGLPATEGRRETLPDGRKIPYLERGRADGELVLETVFGELRIPLAMLEAMTPRRAGADSEGGTGKRISNSKWFRLETDVPEERAGEYRDQLDAFVEWMLDIYPLERDRVRKQAPFRVTVYRSRAEFRRAQEAVLDEIAAAKGKAFGEGVGGFYSPGLEALFFWDSDAGRFQTAKHETTHLLNHLLSQHKGIRMPVWVEEGTAVYFSCAQGKREEQIEDHAAAFATVIGDLEAGNGFGTVALRSTPYATFLSREYSWAWALVRFLRRHRGGAAWEPLLDYLRTCGAGPPTDSENRRFHKAISFGSAEKLDQAWHRHLEKAKLGGLKLGNSPGVLAALDKIKRPSRTQASRYSRIGVSYLRSGQAKAALAYLRAARRGGIRSAPILSDLARAIAEEQGRAEDEMWPEESVEALAEAVAADPLAARYRHLLGKQRLHRAGSAAEVQEARDTLGLAFLLTTDADDQIAVIMSLLRASARHEPDRPLPQVLAWLSGLREVGPETARLALVYHLQEGQSWTELLQVLREALDQGVATFGEREMLAGLLMALGDYDAAADLFGRLLAEESRAYHLWSNRIRSLILAERLVEAARAKEEALAAIDASRGDLSAYRRRIEALEIR